tara:strand:+ start:1465 stop:1932 length:468 start_codon:yes stop_codon:yes gene_type:complete
MKTMKQISKNAMLILAFVATTAMFAQMKPMDGSKMAMSKYSFSETVDILKGAIEQQNLMVLHEIDGQKMMRMAGKETGGMKQLFFFHPSYMAKVMEANEMAGIVIPFKIIVMEKKGMVMVRYFMPSTVLKSYKGTETIASELDGKVTKIIAEATK